MKVDEKMENKRISVLIQAVNPTWAAEISRLEGEVKKIPRFFPIPPCTPAQTLVDISVKFST